LWKNKAQQAKATPRKNEALAMVAMDSIAIKCLQSAEQEENEMQAN
jgi:hypothetical protein